MIYPKLTFQWSAIALLGWLMMSCSGANELANKDFSPSSATADTIISKIPDYQSSLHSVKGKGRAIVSEPGNTERVTVLFSSNRNRSLVTVRNSIGIEGGQLLTDGDTLLVYNKLDKYARKIPIRGSQLNRINKLASLNILDMINYVVPHERVETVLENKELYQLRMESGTRLYINRSTYRIQQVTQPKRSQLPYSKITYDAYADIQGFSLPRKISIFGADEESKVALQLTGMEINPKLDTLTITIPDDIPVYYR